MTTKDIAGKTVQVNEEGFMTDPNEWTNLAGNESYAEIIAEHKKWIPTENTPAKP